MKQFRIELVLKIQINYKKLNEAYKKPIGQKIIVRKS
jgi:hypothetical protein